MMGEAAGQSRTGPVLPLAATVAAQGVPGIGLLLGKLVLQAAQAEVMR